MTFLSEFGTHKNFHLMRQWVPHSLGGLIMISCMPDFVERNRNIWNKSKDG